MGTTRTTHASVDAILRVLDERGISKSELARQLGWGRMQVGRRLSGEAALTVAELEAIAAALGVPVTRFLPTAEPAGGNR